ncbi:hypothetical protein ACFL6G_05110 [candidate division KSB1 bacterium]
MYLFYLFIVTGAVCILFGIIFIIKPALLVRLNTLGNKAVMFRTENQVYTRILGAVVLLLSAYLIYLFYK